MRIRATLAAFALIGLAATTAEAQQAQNPIEIGMDAQISFGLDDQGTTISIPQQKVRAGFVLNPAMTIEPSFGFDRWSAEVGGEDVSTSVLAADVSLLYHFSVDRTQRQFYLRPVVGLMRSSASMAGESDANTDLNIGVAGGMKMPLMDRVGARFEAEFRNYMTDPSMSALNLYAGLSFFTR